MHPSWSVETVNAELDPPLTDSHGDEVTERVAEVIYTADQPLPDDLRDSFELSLQSRFPTTVYDSELAVARSPLAMANTLQIALVSIGTDPAAQR